MSPFFVQRSRRLRLFYLRTRQPGPLTASPSLPPPTPTHTWVLKCLLLHLVHIHTHTHTHTHTPGQPPHSPACDPCCACDPAAAWALPPCSSPATCTSCHPASCQNTAWQARRQAASCRCHPYTPLAPPTSPSSSSIAPNSMHGWCSSKQHTQQCQATQQQQQQRLLVTRGLAAVAAVGAGAAATSHWCRMQQQQARRPGSYQVGAYVRLHELCSLNTASSFGTHCSAVPVCVYDTRRK
jgi:hypothetical protein